MRQYAQNFTSRRKGRGYLLLVTLALLVMCSTLLVSVARLAIGRAREAADANATLQRKWGVASCQNAVLPIAEHLLASDESTFARSAPSVKAIVELNGMRFDLTIADEQAKANVNAMLKSQSPTDVENRLRAVLSGLGVANDIRVRPAYSVGDDETAETLPGMAGSSRPIRSFGQIVDAPSPALLAGARSPVASITCWGDGAINVMRADAAAMQLALWPNVSRVEISGLIATRDRALSGKATKATAAPIAGAASRGLLATAGIDANTASKMTVTEHSTCHSLWIVTSDRQRSWYDFYVDDNTIEPHRLLEQFHW